MVNRAALIVIDGWGERAEEYGNAIMQATTPVMDGFKTDANWAVVEAGTAAYTPQHILKLGADHFTPLVVEQHASLPVRLNTPGRRKVQHGER